MILEVEARLDYEVSEPTTMLLQVEAAPMLDQRILEARFEVADPEHHARVPAEDMIGERSWVRVAERLRCTYAARVEIDRPLLDLSLIEQTPVHELPPDAIKYLMGSRFVPSDRFGSFVAAEFGTLMGGARIAAMRDWIEAHLSYVPGSSDARTTALDTLVERQGVCRDYAHLMIGLARASTIPARIVSAYAPGVDPPDFHAVAEVHLGGSWHLVDATGMAPADTLARVGVGRDAADIAFMTVYGASQLREQSVTVTEG